MINGSGMLCLFLYIYTCIQSPGPSCSKLTMSLVKVSLKISSLNLAYMLILLLKNTCEFGIVLTGIVNILTTNELVRLTML